MLKFYNDKLRITLTIYALANKSKLLNPIVGSFYVIVMLSFLKTLRFVRSIRSQKIPGQLNGYCRSFLSYLADNHPEFKEPSHIDEEEELDSDEMWPSEGSDSQLFSEVDGEEEEVEEEEKDEEECSGEEEYEDESGVEEIAGDDEDSGK